jgi:UDP-N-acetylmuramoyl-tripeptide--D-alanyl-D-alanine ligase
MKNILKKVITTILIWESKLVLKKYKPKIIGITGSVGKTSTKDAVFTALSHLFFVRKSEKSYNSEIGVPLTILGCPNGWNDPRIWFKNIVEGIALILLPNKYPKWLVLEIGADRPGDIESLSKWIRPDICIITRLSKVPVHVEFFQNAEAVYKEKAFLVRALKKDGVLVLNSDDEDVLAYRELFEDTTILYGTKNPADVFGSNYKISYKKETEVSDADGVEFDVSYKDESSHIEAKGGLGHQQVYPILAACAVGVSQGIILEKLAKSFVEHHTSRGRMKILDGVKDTLIIDDSYNSSPVALFEALNTLSDIKTSGRKIAVLGDMLELGTFSVEEHKKVGEQSAKVADILMTVGVRARYIAEGALNAGLHESKIFQFEDSRVAGKELEILLKPQDVVLIKGSQGIRMERTVEEVMENPMLKDRLLVRQDKEWLGR